MACPGCQKRRQMLLEAVSLARAGQIAQGAKAVGKVAGHLVRNPPATPVIRRVIRKN